MRLWSTVVALTLLVAFASDSRGQSPRQNTKSVQQNPSADNRGTEQAPLVVKIIQAEQAKDKTDTTANEGQKNWLDRFSLSDKIAVIASVVAFLQFLALVATVYVMRRTAQRQLRAYVFVDGGSFTLMTTDEGNLYIQGVVVLKNFGQTPGYKFVACTRVDIFETKSPAFRDDAKGLGESVVGPSSERHIPVVKGPIDPADLQAIRDGTKSIFIWGRVDYVDAFGQPRYLKFYNMNGREIPEPGRLSGRWPIDQADKPYEAN
jgi:hypothetical protein